eukprot:GHRQ01025376.1.p3 GENE.GHRQ01025376.1~~GHRQ01025376.1.p3  ORF type:complete len:132 (-),score=27.75 GHRQ01025376.1:90-485(-)
MSLRSIRSSRAALLCSVRYHHRCPCPMLCGNTSVHFLPRPRPLICCCCSGYCCLPPMPQNLSCWFFLLLLAVPVALQVPNASPTAGSASTDLYGMAVMDACRQLNERLKPYRWGDSSGVVYMACQCCICVA